MTCAWCGAPRTGWRKWLSHHCNVCGPALAHSDRPPCLPGSRRELGHVEVGLIVYGVHVWVEGDQILCALDVPDRKGGTERVTVVQTEVAGFQKMGAEGFTKTWS